MRANLPTNQRVDQVTYPMMAGLKSIMSNVRRGPSILGRLALPQGIRSACWLAAGFASIWIVLVPFAALDMGTYSINDRAVSGPYFLTHVYPFIVPFLGILGTMAYGYWTEQLWARPLPFVLACAVAAFIISQLVFYGANVAESVSVVAWCGVITFAAWWYCYRKRSVVAYYTRLGQARRPS